MFLLADTVMRYCRLLLMVIVSASAAVGTTAADERATVIVQLTTAEYEDVLKRFLPCPQGGLRETRDFQLCMVVVPPGHRHHERELLLSLTYREGIAEMFLMQPEHPLGRYARDAKVAGGDDWVSLPGLRMRSMRTTDSQAIARVAGAWESVKTEIVPRGAWYMDSATYRIRSETLFQHVTADLQGPGPLARRQPSELLRWAERARKEAEAILAKAEPALVTPSR